MQRTSALFTWRRKSCARVEHAKGRCGALDFQDLIDKTLALLSRGDAAWVLYKLDRGIDHVLIDEAQDTNPEQWEILRRHHRGFHRRRRRARRALRTLFAVGDPKQSIYGFQGAAPRNSRRAARLEAQGRRSGAGVRGCEPDPVVSLGAGGAVRRRRHFAVRSHFKGLSFDDKAIGTVHESARPHVPGRVELWPAVIPQEEAEPDAWVLPVDEPEQQSPPVVVAGRIAARRQMLDHPAGDETAGASGTAGDVLVLVRKRGARSRR